MPGYRTVPSTGRAQVLRWMLVASLLLTGCASRGGDAAAGGGPAAENGGAALLGPLAGRSFVAVSFDGYDAIFGEPFRLSFLGGELQASAGCSQMSGPVGPSGGVLRAVLTVTPTDQCGPLMGDQGTWVPEMLSGGPAWTLSGSALTLSTSLGSVTFQETTPEVDGLTDIGWRLTGVIRDGAVTEVPAGTGAGIVLRGGMLTLDTGTLGGRSPFRFSEDRLFLDSLSLGGTSYQAGGRGPVDDVMPAVLLATPSVLVEGDQLTLTAADGPRALRFVRDARVFEATSNPQSASASSGGPGPTATTGS